jgi:hypothetical protein
MKSIRDSKQRLTVRGKPRKRAPKTGTPVVVRLQDDMLRSLDAWMRSHGPASRPEAVRQILRQTLRAK